MGAFQDVRMLTQDVPKTPKMPPRRPKRPQDTAKAPQNAARRPNTSPTCSQDAPKTPQDASKTPPRRPKPPQRRLQKSIPRRCPTSVHVGQKEWGMSSERLEKKNSFSHRTGSAFKHEAAGEHGRSSFQSFPARTHKLPFEQRFLNNNLGTQLRSLRWRPIVFLMENKQMAEAAMTKLEKSLEHLGVVLYHKDKTVIQSEKQRPSNIAIIVRVVPTGGSRCLVLENVKLYLETCVFAPLTIFLHPLAS